MTGSCKVNVTCDFDVKPEIKPEKQAALFAKEFEDKLYQTIFPRDTDDIDESTTAPSTRATTIPSTGSNQPNCSHDVQVRTGATMRPGGGHGVVVGRWTCNPEVLGSNPPPCHWMDLSSVALNSTPPRCVNGQLVSLPPVGILNVLHVC